MHINTYMYIFIVVPQQNLNILKYSKNGNIVVSSEIYNVIRIILITVTILAIIIIIIMTAAMIVIAITKLYYY